MYYIGISSQDNQNYSPFTGWWDQPGSTGDYSLPVIKTDGQESVDAPVLNAPTGQLNIGGSVTWDAVQSATQYDMWVEGVSGSQRYNGLSSASWKIPASFANGDYSIRVRAWNGSVVSDWGSAVNVRVRVTAPSQVSVDSVSEGTSAEIRWGSVSEAETYNVYIRNDRTGQVIRDTTDGTSFQLPQNLISCQYQVLVQAVNRVGRGIWSQAFVFQIGSRKPGQVEGLRSQSDSGSLRPVITWREASHAVSYDVYIRNKATGEVIRGANVIGTRFQPSEDLAYGTYQVWVQARNSAGTGTWSNSLTFTVSMAPPETPTGLRVTSTTADSTPTLDWNPASRTQMYELYIRNRATGAVIRDTAVSYTDYTFTQPLNNGSYQVWIRAINSSGASHWTRPIEMIVNSPNAVSFGQNPIAGSAKLNLHFSWMQVAGAKSYEYQIVRLGDLRPDVEVESNVTTKTNFAFELPDMVSGKHNYRISVRAITDDGASSWSSQIVSHNFSSIARRDRYTGRIVVIRTITMTLGES